MISSLLNAIVTLDGEALVLNADQRPHIVTLTGNVEIGSRPLPAHVIASLSDSLLSPASRVMLSTFGSAADTLASELSVGGDRFVASVTARPVSSMVIRRERGLPAANPLMDRPARRSRLLPLVLLIDDSVDQLDLYEVALMDKFTVMTASAGKEGVALAMAEQPDVIVVDLNMPRMNGLDVCRELGQHRETMNIPIVMLTATDEFKVADAAARVGVSDLLHKPCSVDCLRDHLAIAAQHQRQL